MTSFRVRVASLSVVGLLVATGCPSDDTGDSGNDSVGMTTMPMTTDAMDSGTDTAPGDSSGSTALSHATDIQPIWDEHCTMACHEPDGEWGFLLDMSGDAYAAIVEVSAPQFSSLNHIEPGDLDASYLWLKINDMHADAGGSGLPMPKARAGMPATMLSGAQLDMIEEWILGGAPM